MADNKKQQLTIWGRANSVNVQKVLWCLAELDLAYERIDAGMQFGKNTEAAYLAMNPNGRVPTLVDGDYVLWESNAICRYLATKHGRIVLLRRYSTRHGSACSQSWVVVGSEVAEGGGPTVADSGLRRRVMRPAAATPERIAPSIVAGKPVSTKSPAR